MPRSTIGKKRHRLTLRQPPSVPAPDASGEDLGAYTSVATRWAEVEPLAGRELWAAQQVQADVTHTVTLRYYAGLGPKWELLWGTRTLRVESVLNPGERHGTTDMVLLCKEQV